MDYFRLFRELQAVLLVRVVTKRIVPTKGDIGGNADCFVLGLEVIKILVGGEHRARTC